MLILLLLQSQGASEKHVHGQRARALQRKAAKELKKTSKWAARELHSLEALHRRFMRDARYAARLERSVPASYCHPHWCMLFVSGDPFQAL